MIPESFVQEVLARVDIVDLIERYVPLKKGGANYLACCPFHNEKSPSFTVSPTKQFYHCFGCGVHGTAIGFLMEYNGIGFVDALKELAQICGLQVPQETNVSAKDSARSASLIDIMANAARYYQEQLQRAPHAQAYLKKRGLSQEVCTRFGIGYAPSGWQNLQHIFKSYEDPVLVEAGLVIANDNGRRYDRFRDRIMFPILDQRGNPIAFGGRILEAGEPKYLNSPETTLFEKGRELYGLTQARQAMRESNCALVVEGYMDVVALNQYNVGNAVATLGTATSGTHIQKLLRLTDRVVFSFDGDQAGQKAAERALANSLEHLADDKTIAFLFLPAQHDPDSYVRENGSEAFRQAMAKAVPLSEFLLNVLKKECNLDTAEGRAKLLHDAKAWIPKIGALLIRAQVIRSLSQESGLSQTEVEQSLGLKPTWRGKAPPKALPRVGRINLQQQLLRMLLHYPTLCDKIGSGQIEQLPVSGERDAILAILDLHALGELNQHNMASLYEYFRSTPHAVSLQNIIALSADTQPEAEEMDGLLRTLQIAALERELQDFHERMRVTTPSVEELTRYKQILAEKQQLKSGQGKQHLA